MSDHDKTLSEYFTHDHQLCDSAWAKVEDAAEQGTREDIAAAWQRFRSAMKRHFEMEEELIFPAFEAATGMTEGPTRVMRSEHTQMRALLDQMDGCLGAGDVEELVDLGDTLMLLIQQHNQKEEHMLYPMADRALAKRWAGLRGKLQQFDEPL